MSWLFSVLSSQSVVIELDVCAVVLTRGLRLRPHAVARAVLLAVALLVALWIPQYVVELMPAAPGELALVALELSKFVPLFLVLLGAVGALFDVSPWGRSSAQPRATRSKTSWVPCSRSHGSWLPR